MKKEDFNPQEYSRKLVQWLKDTCKKYPADGFVLGLSGGIDSAVCAALLAKTNLPIMTILLPSKNNSRHDLDDANELLEKFKLPSILCHIQDAYEVFLDTTKVFENENNSRQNAMKGNIQARLRMIYLYTYAQQNNYIVVGTDNACEWHMGYFTKHGDGAADVVPLINLDKEQVFEIGKYLGVTNAILKKDPSAGLWDGQTDEDEMGVSYDEINTFLQGDNVSKKALERINFWHNRSHHKRAMAISPDF